MSLKIDFDELPYDLFKLLELSEDCLSKDVKKAYKKAVLKYHPDKNKDISDEYFSWISLAHKILSNPEHREMYIEWKNWQDDHLRLRTNNREKINISTDKSYKQLNDELNIKHGYKEDKTPLNSSEMSSKISKLQKERDSVIIPKEIIGDINKAVDNLKQDFKKLESNNQEIIGYTGEITTLTTCLKYGALDDIGKLYVENDNIITDRITNLNSAFSLSHYQKYNPDNLTLEEKMKLYETETKNLSKVHKKPKS